MAGYVWFNTTEYVSIQQTAVMQERMWKVCRSFYCGNTSHNTYNIAHALSRSDRQQDIKAHMYLKKKKIAHMNIITLTLVSCTLNGTAQRERQE